MFTLIPTHHFDDDYADIMNEYARIASLLSEIFIHDKPPELTPHTAQGLYSLLDAMGTGMRSVSEKMSLENQREFQARMGARMEAARAHAAQG